MNPLWVDARDYLTSQGQKVTTHGLNEAMNLLAANPQLRPSAVKAGGGAAGIAAGLGAPTDQIVSTPLAPPVTAGGSPSPSPRAAGRSKQGASSGNRTAGGTSASGKTVKDIPAGVGNYAAAGSQDRSNQYGITPPAPTQMGGYTPGAPPSQPSSPVGSAQAGTGADDPGFLAHLMGGDYNGRLAAGAGGLAAVLGALLMGRGGSSAGVRPRGEAPVSPSTALEPAGLSGEIMPPEQLSGPPPNLPTIYGRPVLNDPIQQLLGRVDRTDYGAMHGGPTYGLEDYGASNGRDPDSAPQVAGPQSFEDMIAQLAASAPQGAIAGPGGRAIAPPAARPPIQMPNQTSGPPINMPPTGGQQLMQILQGLGRQ